MSNLPGLSFGCLNLRSCNLTDASGKNCIEKFTWIIDKRFDIVFLSEVKFHNHFFLEKLNNFLALNDKCQYSLVLNSTKCSRGTAILLKTCLNYKINETYKSDDENLTVISLAINDVNITLAAVYAPSNNSSAFFESVKRKVESYGHPFVIGGDHNTVLSALPTSFNPDLHLHESQCNITGTRFLNEWIDEGKIIDPYRYLFPTGRDFSFVKDIRGIKSKARLDFFLVSTEFSEFIANAEYELTPSQLFDHRLCSFRLRRSVKPIKKPIITPEAISDPEMKRQANLAALNIINLYAINGICDRTTEHISELNRLNSQIISLSKYLENNNDLYLTFLKNKKVDEFESIMPHININEILENGTFSIKYIDLLRMLGNEVKLIGHSLTASVKKSRRGHLDVLRYRIRTLKEQGGSTDDVASLEEKLQTFINVESNVLHRKRSLKNLFFAQNDMSILSASMNKKVSAPLTVIKNDVGAEFLSCNERDEYILKFYKNIYEKNVLPTENINTFLNDLPNRAPIDENLTDKLCAEISNLEILTVIKSLGKTSTGVDGIPNLLVKTLEETFVPFMRIAFNKVLNNEEQFHKDMKLSYVKLIPKKMT